MENSIQRGFSLNSAKKEQLLLKVFCEKNVFFTLSFTKPPASTHLLRLSKQLTDDT